MTCQVPEGFTKATESVSFQLVRESPGKTFAEARQACIIAKGTGLATFRTLQEVKALKELDVNVNSPVRGAIDLFHWTDLVIRKVEGKFGCTTGASSSDRVTTCDQMAFWANSTSV